jgi:hypothetical protein
MVFTPKDRMLDAAASMLAFADISVIVDEVRRTTTLQMRMEIIPPPPNRERAMMVR